MRDADSIGEDIINQQGMDYNRDYNSIIGTETYLFFIDMRAFAGS
jgi:hypothetical protein